MEDATQLGPGNGIKPSQAQPSAFDVMALDNLSNGLAKVAASLQGVDADAELEFRPQVIDAVMQFSRSRYELGRVLFQYREKWKADGAWLKACKVIACALKVSTRTLHRVIEDFVRTSPLPANVLEVFESEGLDPAAKRNEALVARVLEMLSWTDDAPGKKELTLAQAKEAVKLAKAFVDPRKHHPRLTEEERQVFELREHIRKGLQGVPPKQQMSVLRQALNEAAFLVLRMTTSFNLEVRPCCGTVTIDGQKRNAQHGRAA